MDLLVLSVTLAISCARIMGPALMMKAIMLTLIMEVSNMWELVTLHHNTNQARQFILM